LDRAGLAARGVEKTFIGGSVTGTATARSVSVPVGEQDASSRTRAGSRAPDLMRAGT
jgi:hypothetical protein